MSLSITAIFCCLDDFAKTFEDWERHHLLPTGRKRRRSGKLCLSEMLFIMVLFHLSPFKDFKHFWNYGVEQKYRAYFGEIPSYGRFVSLMPRLFIPFCVLMHSLTGDQTGIYVADSTKIAVCHNLRISATASSPAWPNAEKPQPAGSMASSCTWSSTTRAKSWLSNPDSG